MDVAIRQSVRRVGWIALASAVLTVGLIAFGAWVRASGSGLGCPDWPLCYGMVVPELEGETTIEFSHRIFAGIVMLTVAVGAVFSYRSRRWESTLFKLMAVTLAVILLQAVLGGITVLTELHGAVRFAHLVMAMLTLGLLTAAAIRGLDIQPSISPGFGIASGMMALSVFVMLIGGLLVWHGLGAACPGLPLCDERSSTTAAWLHNLHRLSAGILTVALLVVAVRMMRQRGTRLATGLNHSAAFLAVSQIAIGVFAVINIMPEGLRVLHVAVATLIWWAVVTQWILAYRIRGT